MKELKINNLVSVQNNFLGNGAIYHGYAGMPDDCGRVYTPEQCEEEAIRAEKMSLNVARTFYTWWAWDEKRGVWNWDNQVMTCFYHWLARMKKAGITIALNTGWCSPGDIDGTGWTNTPPFTKCPFIVAGDYAKTVQNYADWVSETLHQLVEIRGFDNIKILVMFTEPEGSGLNAPNRPYQTWLDCVTAAHKTLVRDGRRNLVKLLGPNEASIPGGSQSGRAGEMLKWVIENIEPDVIDIYSCHVYPFAGPIPKKYLKTGKSAVSMNIAGGRFCRTVDLIPGTDYTLSVDLLFENTKNEDMEGVIYFGAFADDGRNDVLIKGGPAEPVADGARGEVSCRQLTNEYRRYEVKFNSGDATSAVVGVFYDLRGVGVGYAEQLILTCDKQSGNCIPNGSFENGTDGWRLLYASGSVDMYDSWYVWAKQAKDLVPTNKGYCYDEYNVIYNKDFSRPSHGAEIVNAAVAMMNVGADLSFMWTLFDQQWPSNHATTPDAFHDGDHRYGVAPTLFRSYNPHYSYYAFSLISKYVVGGGTKIYEGFGGDCLHTTMAEAKDGNITVIVVNNKETDDEFNLKFQKSVNKNLNRHLFDPATVIPDEKAELITSDVTLFADDCIKDKIPAYGVAVYTTY